MSSFISLRIIVEKSEDVIEREKQKAMGIRSKSEVEEHFFCDSYVRPEDIVRLTGNKTMSTDEPCTVVHFIDDTTLFTLEDVHSLRKRIEECESKSELGSLFSRRS